MFKLITSLFNKIKSDKEIEPDEQCPNSAQADFERLKSNGHWEEMDGGGSCWVDDTPLDY